MGRPPFLRSHRAQRGQARTRKKFGSLEVTASSMDGSRLCKTISRHHKQEDIVYVLYLVSNEKCYIIQAFLFSIFS